MAIISKAWAHRLIHEGRASHEGTMTDNGQRYAIIQRNDLQRQDHYPIEEKQAGRPARFDSGRVRYTVTVPPEVAERIPGKTRSLQREQIEADINEKYGR